eukprot:scaffold8759_cov135-Isochrysis_galbana.AAC.4
MTNGLSSFEQLSSKLVGARRISHYGAAVELDTYLCARLPLLQQLVSSDTAPPLRVCCPGTSQPATCTRPRRLQPQVAQAVATLLTQPLRQRLPGLVCSTRRFKSLSAPLRFSKQWTRLAVGEAAGIDRLDVAFSARCILLTRYLVDAPGWLKLKHPLFDDLPRPQTSANYNP